MRFVADGMLGKVTRWLRLLGEDVKCVNDFQIPSEEEDSFLLDLAEEESRVLLTRDVDLNREALKNNLKSVLLEDEEESPVSQINLISEKLDVSFDISLDSSRCSVCNGQLEKVEKSEIVGQVPDGVLENSDVFWRCEDCGKVYWCGAHWENIEEAMRKLRD